jgi:hypothetical protein
MQHAKVPKEPGVTLDQPVEFTVGVGVQPVHVVEDLTGLAL